MNFEGYHLAQLNIAKLKKPIEDKSNWRFNAYLDPINEFAENTEGFVWRLKDEDGNATSIQAFNDPNLIINLTVWESIESLYNFTYSGEHSYVFKQRSDWFDKMERFTTVLWWIQANQNPDIEEAKTKLESLNSNGPTVNAFNFKQTFSPNGDPYVIKRDSN